MAESSSSRYKHKQQCHHCNQSSHNKDGCPFVNSKCNAQWLDEAILELHGYEVPSQACFCCGDPSHWMEDCKWNSLPCTKKGCNGSMALKTTKKPESLEKQYLKCRGYMRFKWFNRATYEHLEAEAPVPLIPASPQSLKVFSEATVDSPPNYQGCI